MRARLVSPAIRATAAAANRPPRGCICAHASGIAASGTGVVLRTRRRIRISVLDIRMRCRAPRSDAGPLQVAQKRHLRAST